MTAKRSNPDTSQPRAGNATEYQFGEFRVIPAQWKLYRDDEELKLEPKLYDLLLFLIERRDKVVSKDELLQALWPNMVIEESGLLRNISLLRQALGDAPPYRYIETIRNQGYRLSCKVETTKTAERTSAREAVSADVPVNPGTSLKISRPLKIAATLVTVALLTLLVVMQFSGRHNPKFSIKQITTNSAELAIRHAAISPDGKAIAFTDNAHLYFSDMENIDRRTLTLPDGVLPGQLSWFPNGMDILVAGARVETGEIAIWKASALTSQFELLLHDAHLPSASPDGKQVAYVKGSDQLWIANEDGTSARLLVKASDENRYYLQPQFSRDGQYLVTLRIDAGGMNSVFEAHRISDGKTVLLHQSRKTIEGFCLVRDNELMLSIMPADNERRTQIVSIPVALDSGALRDASVLVDWPGFLASDITATIDGNSVMVINSKNYANAYVADLAKDGNSITNVRKQTNVNGSNQPAGWFHDNRTALFSSGRNGHRGIYKQDITANEAQPLVANQVENVLPIITADERWLFYFAFDAESQTRDMPISLMKIALSGGKPELIGTRNDFYWMLHCATSAPRCLLEEHEDDQRIYISFDPDTGDRKELLRTAWIAGISFYDWDISPDGTQLAFIDEATDPNNIAIVSLASPSIIKRIHVTHHAALRTLVWDAKGSGFYSSTYGINGELLQLLHIDMNGDYHLLRSELDTKDGWAIPSPDGRHLLIHGYSPQSNIWLMRR